MRAGTAFFFCFRTLEGRLPRVILARGPARGTRGVSSSRRAGTPPHRAPAGSPPVSRRKASRCRRPCRRRSSRPVSPRPGPRAGSFSRSRPWPGPLRTKFQRESAGFSPRRRMRFGRCGSISLSGAFRSAASIPSDLTLRGLAAPQSPTGPWPSQQSTALRSGFQRSVT